VRSSPPSRRRAFTLIEVLVTTALVATVIVAGMGAIRAIGVTEGKMRDADLLQKLASEKLGDVRFLSDPTSTGTSGDFTDRGYSDITWSLDDQASSVSNVDQLTVTVTKGKEEQSLTTLVYIPSSTSSSSSSSSTSAGAASP
jgi:prepilin-type N-terminal cleavage/methylation domain-containing protein